MSGPQEDRTSFALLLQKYLDHGFAAMYGYAAGCDPGGMGIFGKENRETTALEQDRKRLPVPQPCIVSGHGFCFAFHIGKRSDADQFLTGDQVLNVRVSAVGFGHGVRGLCLVALQITEETVAVNCVSPVGQYRKVGVTKEFQTTVQCGHDVFVAADIVERIKDHKKDLLAAGDTAVIDLCEKTDIMKTNTAAMPRKNGGRIMKKRYVIAGTSNRAFHSYIEPLVKDPDISAAGEIVGLYDKNIGRAKYVASCYGGLPVYDDFDEMLRISKPDCVIVTCTDYAHATYIVKGLLAGCDVFTEKPMCITAQQCREILETEKKVGKRITVCFNARFEQDILALKQMVKTGVLGDIYNVHFEWLLTQNYRQGSGHGASYYRRWNAYMAMCGGLLLTKATHHFDMANWLIGSKPKRVSAFGKLRNYGAAGRYPYRGERCSNCRYAKECPYYSEINEYMRHLYVENEQYDGYMIDRCVFDPEIDIYDTMSLNVEYENDVLMSYSESSAAMYEGFKIYINGSKGRLEAQRFASGGLRQDESPDFMRVIDLQNNVTTYARPADLPGEHGGADPGFRRVFFLGEEPILPEQRANSTDGAWSILIGAAANESIKTGKIITIDDFLGDGELLKR